jgi:hypothetical protein
MIAAIVYVLCALTSVVTMVLLFRAYAARRVRLLPRSSRCRSRSWR